MAVSEVLRALDMLAQQRQRKAYDPLIAADRLGSIIGNIGDKERRYRERDEAQQQSQDFQRQMTLEQEQRRERAAAVAQGQDRLRQIESNRALSDVLGENIPAALDPVAARGYAGDVMRQRGFDARNAAEIEQERIRAQQDAAEAAAKAQAAQAAAQQDLYDRSQYAATKNLPMLEYWQGNNPILGGPTGTPLPSMDVLKGMAAEQARRTEEARMQRENDPNFKAGELLFKLKQGLPTGLPEGVAPHQYLQEIAPRDANGQMHPDWVTKWVGEFSKMTRPKEEGDPDPFGRGARERDQELDRMVRETRGASEQLSELLTIQDEAERTKAARGLGIPTSVALDPDALRRKIEEAQAKAHAAMLKRNQFYKDRGEMPPYLEIE